MFYELGLPERSSSYAPKCWVASADDQLEMFLRVDGSVDSGEDDMMEYLFETFDEAILASAAYYHNNGYVYPYQTEMIAAGKCFLKNEKKEKTVESTTMVFK